MSETGFALVAPEDVVIDLGSLDCSSFRPLTPIAEMKMAVSNDGLKHVLELDDENGRAYSGTLPYMAQVNAIGFLRREHGMKRSYVVARVR